MASLREVNNPLSRQAAAPQRKTTHINWGQVAQNAPGGPAAFQSFARGEGPNPYSTSLSSYASPRPTIAPSDEYLNQFRNSLAASRAGIESSFRSALEDIGKREGNAQAAVNLLPGQVQGIYDRSGQNLASAQQTLDAGQQAANLTSYATAAQQMAPLAAASGQDLAARQADVPLLRLGTTAVFDQQRGGLNQAKLSAASDLDAEERGYLTQADMFAREQAAQQQRDAEDRDFQLRLSGTQSDSDLMGRNWLAEQDFARQKAADDMEAKQAAAEERRSLNTFGGQNASAGRGQFIAQYSPQVYDRVTSSKPYQRAQQRINRLRDNENDDSDVENAAASLERRGLYRTAAALRYRNNKGRIGRKG